MNNIKWISIGVVGSLFAVSHLGLIGYIASKKDEPRLDYGSRRGDVWCRTQT